MTRRNHWHFPLKDVAKLNIDACNVRRRYSYPNFTNRSLEKDVPRSGRNLSGFS
jgi:hypothetical protein